MLVAITTTTTVKNMYYSKILDNKRQRGTCKRAKEYKQTEQNFSAGKVIFWTLRISVMLLRDGKHKTSTERSSQCQIVGKEKKTLIDRDAKNHPCKLDVISDLLI